MALKHALVFLVLAFASLGAYATSLDNCAILDVNTAFFNLCPFSQIDTGYSDVDEDIDIQFSLGNAHTPSCDGKSSVWGTATFPQDSNDCIDLAVDSPTLSLVDSDDSDSGLVLTYPVNSASGQTNPMALRVILYCDANGNTTAGAATFSRFNESDTTFYNLNATSYYGCPYATLNQIVTFLNNYKYPFIAIAVVLGLFLLLFGFRLFKYALFIVTLVAGTLFSGMLFFEFVKFGSQEWILWVIFGACVLVGIVLGYLAVRYERLGFFFLGAALGVVGGLILYNAVLVHFMQGENVLFYVVMVVLGLIGGGLGVWLWKDIIIIGTSLIGSYLGVRAVSVVIGGFPNEIAVAKGVENLNGVAYAYLAVIALLAIGGIYYQYREKRRLEDEEEQETTSAFYRKN